MSMTIKILLPHKIFMTRKGVVSITAESPYGSFGLLPHRLDCVSPLAPGILVCKTEDNLEHYIAIDKGILVKTGAEVRVSVRNAFGGSNLGKLKEQIDGEFNNLSEDEKAIKVSLAKLESNLVRQLNELQKNKL